MPSTAGVTIHDAVTVKLNGSGEILHIVNDRGAAVTVNGQAQYLVTYPQ